MPQPKDNSASEVAKWIEENLNDLAINQLELAKASGLDNKTIHFILHGKVVRVNSKTIGKLRRGIEKLTQGEKGGHQGGEEVTNTDVQFATGVDEMILSQASLRELSELLADFGALLKTLLGAVENAEWRLSRITEHIQAETALKLGKAHKEA